jgi:hypothetical protein
MRSVKIKTNELLAVLKKNRQTHEVDYNESMKGYREAVVHEIESALKKAKNGQDVHNFIRAVRPTSYLKSYDTIIRMIEMSSEDTVELTMQEFSQYVEDEWQWKEAFAATRMVYNNK